MSSSLRVAGAYGRFEEHVISNTSVGTKQGPVRDFVLLHTPAMFPIADIRRAVPGVSDNTIRIALDDLKMTGSITSSRTGRVGVT